MSTTTTAPAPHEHKSNDWSSTTYSTNASFVYSAAFASPVLALLEPLSPSSKILDLGCGSGELTIQIANKLSKEGIAKGCDISSDMIRRGRELEGLEGDRVGGVLEWEELEGNRVNELEGQGSFDVVFSSAAIHWMKSDPPRVIRNVYGLLKPGGKFCGEFGGFMNVGGVRSTLYAALRRRGHDPVPCDPWFWPTPTHYRKLLEEAGFRVESCELIPRINPLPTGLRGWLEVFGMSFFAPLKSSVEKEEMIEEVCEQLAVDLRDDEGNWECMYTRLRFVAFKV